jgi:hypothetical protein
VNETNGLREQVRVLAAEVALLRSSMEEVKLDLREEKTNWRLAIALGGLLGTLVVGIVLVIVGAAVR